MIDLELVDWQQVFIYVMGVIVATPVFVPLLLLVVFIPLLISKIVKPSCNTEFCETRDDILDILFIMYKYYLIVLVLVVIVFIVTNGFSL